MEKVLAVYDPDVVYATRFLEFFQKRKDIEFEILAFTKKDSLEDFLKHRKIEILLFDSSISLEEILKENIRYIYELTEHPRRDNDTGYPKVLKYQAAQSVMAEVIGDYNGRENNTPCEYETGKFKLITIFTPVPNAEKLLFAWSMSMLLAEKKKVLFILLDSLPVPVLSQDEGENQGLSEFIYYLKENNPNIMNKMKTLLHFIGNLAYLSGITNGLDLFSLTREEMLCWTEELKNHTDYDEVVFYASHYSDAVIEILNHSNTVVMPILDCPYERAVHKEWEKQMNFMGMKEMLSKVQEHLLTENVWSGDSIISIQALQNNAVWEEAVHLAQML